MYVAIRRQKIQPGLIDEAVRRVEDELVPIISSVPGFVEYDVLPAGCAKRAPTAHDGECSQGNY